MAALPPQEALALLIQHEVHDRSAASPSSSGALRAAIEQNDQKVASATAALSGVLYDARVLSDSLTTLHAAAESAVKNMRQLDAQKNVLQRILDKVEDMLDLRSCLAGAQAALAADDSDALAMHVRQFRAVRSSLNVPEADEVFMKEAEDRLVTRTLASFDLAIGMVSDAAAGREHTQQQAQVLAQGQAAVARCCQTLALLGRGADALHRFISYLSTSLSAECLAELRAAAAVGGLEGRAAAVNLASALFTRAVQALDGPAGDTGSLLGTETGPAAVLIAVHTVVEHAAARVLRSFNRSARVHAALKAREAMLAAAATGVAQAQTSNEDYVSPSSATAAAALLTAVDNQKNEAPFGVPQEAVHGTRVDGVDLGQAPVLDAFLDETALLLQRCASYFRLMLARAQGVAAPALVGHGHVATDATDSKAETAEAAVRAQHALADSVGELAGTYSAIETASIRSGVSKAVSLDEPLEDGAWGAGLDLMDVTLATGPKPTGAAAGSLLLQDSGGLSPAAQGAVANGHGTTALPVGGGGMCGTVVEDAGYVLRRSASRAIATGNADAAAGVLSSLAFALEQQLLFELDARVKLAVLDIGSAEVARTANSLGLNQQALDRIGALRRAAGQFALSRLSGERLTAYATLGLPGRAGAGPSSLEGSRGTDGPGGKQQAASAVDANTGATASARMTEDTAFLCLSLVNLQLACEVTERLHAGLAQEASEVFQDAKEANKVRAALSGLSDDAASLRRALDSGLGATMSRLTPRLRSALHVFEGGASLVSYEISEAGYEALSWAGAGAMSGGGAGGAGMAGPGGSGALDSSGQAGGHGGHGGHVSHLNPFTTEFLPVLGAILAPYALCLTPSLASALTMRVAGYVCRQLEPRLKRKRFTGWGALLLDSDIRALVAFFTARSSRKVRERCSRLLAMVAVLNVDRPQDVHDLFGWKDGPATGASGTLPGSSAQGAAEGSGALGWNELTRAEVREILKLRLDFSTEQVDAAVPV